MSYDDRRPDGATKPAEYRGAFTTRPCPECGATIMGWRVRCDDCAAPARVSPPDSAVDTEADDE